MAGQDRTATPVWEGDLRKGKGKGEVSFDSSGAAGPVPVSFPSRFERAGGQTSPEELLAAAQDAERNCPVSKAIAGNVEVTLDASLKS